MQAQIRDDGIFIPKILFKNFDNIQIIEKPDFVIIKSLTADTTEQKDKVDAIEESFGLWKDKELDSLNYVDEIRDEAENRLEELDLD